MDHLFFQPAQCPYCGEPIEIQVDPTAGPQAYVEDCSVCCRPIEVRLMFAGDECRLQVQRDDD